jgi:hypothetical protein
MGRKKIYNNSSVISIRVSDEELLDIKMIMDSKRIDKVSDLMRKAIHLFKSNLPTELPDGRKRSKRPCRTICHENA